MGNVAVAMQEYLGNVERFADLFNGVFFHGEQVLAPEQLCEQSERYAVKQKVFPEEHRKGKRKLSYKEKRKEEFRDVKKKLKALMLEDPAYQSLPGDTVEVMTELLNWNTLTEESNKHMEKDENGRERYNMCKTLMEIREEGQEIGERIGDNSRTRIVVTNMLRRGYSTEDICAIAECSEQLVDELRESLSE